MSQAGVVAAPAPSLRVTCYVDGFNLYHGLKEHTKCRPYRWLNLWSLATSLLDKNHVLERVVFFTSVPPWNTSKRRRHETYIAALRSAGIEIVQGRFQSDEMLCRATCRNLFPHYVEKLTDVNISTSILSDGVTGRFDWAYLMSGDADQAPTIRALHQIAPGCKVRVIFPPRRESAELRSLADDYIGPLGFKALRDNQFPATIATPLRTIQKPNEWILDASPGSSSGP